MTSLKTKQEHAEAARTLASSFELVRHGGITYIPAHWQTEDIRPLPDAADRIWLPLSREDKEVMGREISQILFATETELSNFCFMLKQLSVLEKDVPSRLLMRTDDGLRVLTEKGELLEPDGTFIPNFIRPKLNTDEGLKKEVFDTIKHWVDSEEEAHSLLHHLATCLAPGWSATKYVLLIGDGRNGKSILMMMMADLFGPENTSQVTRQDMSKHSSVCVALNGKLLNIVFDGAAEYLKDSGAEKSLVTGETVPIRQLYETGTTPVQTNALFIEGLNKEPKTRDKGVALQKRIVRFFFPQEFEKNLQFERHMRSEPMLGAFLAVLMDHFVLEYEQAEKLQLSASSMAMQLEQMHTNSPVLQYLEHEVQVDPRFMDTLEGALLEQLVSHFMAWRLNEGYETFSSVDTLNMFKEFFHTYQKSVRDGNKVVKKRAIRSAKSITVTFLNQLITEGGDDEDLTELVAD